MSKEAINIGLIILDNNRIVEFNKTAEKILGYKFEEIIGKTCEEIFVNPAPRGGARVNQSNNKGLIKNMVDQSNNEAQFKIELLTKKGEKIPIIMNIFRHKVETYKNKNSKLSFLLFQDLRDRKKMQEHLAHLNRLKSLGELTAGFVHEIRNPLASISTNVQYINQNINPTFKYYDEVQDILLDISAMENFIEKILKFAKPGKPQIINTNVNDVIEEVLKFLKKKFRSIKINLEKNYDEELLLVLADPEQIKQVLINIFTNAYQAMPQGGTLTISTRRFETPRLNIHRGRDKVKFSSIKRQQSGVEIIITDTGCGITPENIDKIFDPFFTTNHEGTGLGLSISQRIIEQHGGSIRVESKLGQGTVFTINLPPPK